MGNYIPIPQTIARLRPYIDVYAVRGGSSVEDAVNGIVSGTETKIATIRELTIDMKRDTDIWRELNTDRAGLPREVYPTLPTYELSLSKIMLNKDLFDASGNRHESLMTLFGFNDFNGGFDIISQTKPLIIKVSLESPRDSDGKVIAGYPTAGSLLFYDCWLDSFPLQFSAEGRDMLITQESKAKAAGVIFASAGA